MSNTCTTTLWTRVSAGHYHCREWTIRGSSKCGWFLFRNGRPWGRWVNEAGWRRYVPFGTMGAAMAAADREQQATGSRRTGGLPC